MVIPWNKSGGVWGVVRQWRSGCLRRRRQSCRGRTRPTPLRKGLRLFNPTRELRPHLRMISDAITFEYLKFEHREAYRAENTHPFSSCCSYRRKRIYFYAGNCASRTAHLPSWFEIERAWMCGRCSLSGGLFYGRGLYDFCLLPEWDDCGGRRLVRKGDDQDYCSFSEVPPGF
jgi:hypothetical protein